MNGVSRHCAFVMLAGLVACSNAVPTSSEPADAAIARAQAAADAASTAYAGCVDTAAKAIDVSLDQPPVLADKAMKQCVTERAAAVAKVHAAEMARGGDAMIAMEVAERSVRVADFELRDRANTVIVTRKLKAN